jgi:hypothetical protein
MINGLNKLQLSYKRMSVSPSIFDIYIISVDERWYSGNFEEKKSSVFQESILFLW